MVIKYTNTKCNIKYKQNMGWRNISFRRHKQVRFHELITIRIIAGCESFRHVGWEGSTSADGKIGKSYII